MTLTAHLSYFLVLLLAGQGLSDSLLTKVNVSNLLSIPTPPLGSFLYELAYFSSSFLFSSFCPHLTWQCFKVQMWQKLGTKLTRRLILIMVHSHGDLQ